MGSNVKRRRNARRKGKARDREEGEIVDEWDLAGRLKRQKCDEQSTLRRGLNIKSCSITKQRPTPSQHRIDYDSISEQAVASLEDQATLPRRFMSGLATEQNETPSSTRLTALSPPAPNNVVDVQTGNGQKMSPMVVLDDESGIVRSAASSLFEDRLDPIPPPENGSHDRYKRLAALAKKHTLSSARQESFVNELDDIDADLIVEQRRNQEMFSLLEQAREEIGRLNRHLNYRQGKVTDLEQALQTERDRVTEMCCQREEREAKERKLMAHIKMMVATDFALREKCRTMEEELEEAKDTVPRHHAKDELRMFVSEGTQTIPDSPSPPARTILDKCSASSKSSTKGPSPASATSRHQTPDPDPGTGPINLSLSPELPICMEELRAWEEGVYQAPSAPERGARVGDLKTEIEIRGLKGMSEKKTKTVLGSYG